MPQLSSITTSTDHLLELRAVDGYEVICLALLFKISLIAHIVHSGVSSLLSKNQLNVNVLNAVFGDNIMFTVLMFFSMITI